ncbi:hypothetical protein GCM10022207_08120 [Streptomyces lannensis]|uniref:Uncharacterized protein n=1 Tax=Streptomyces lannensis TaxID=766498 RepID=A0ABP7JMJ5_9ACTN
MLRAVVVLHDHRAVDVLAAVGEGAARRGAGVEVVVRERQYGLQGPVLATVLADDLDLALHVVLVRQEVQR